MKIIKPYFTIEPVDGLALVHKLEKAARVCYKSEERITTDSYWPFLSGIIKRGHTSTLEHESVTVNIVCDRGVSHEIVRHRIGISFSQESTRYCDYGDGDVVFILPPWVTLDEKFINTSLQMSELMPTNLMGKIDTADWSWLMAMVKAEESYQNLRNYSKWTPQQARAVLPNSLKTEIVVTANIRAWRHFFDLRADKAAHPQMREIAVPMLKEFQQMIPLLFDDIIPYEGALK